MARPSGREATPVKVGVETLGCRVNQYDSELLLQGLRDLGFEQARPGEPADLWVVNTCSVTGVADAKSRRAVQRARGLNPGARVAVIGCLPAGLGEESRRALGADLVFGAGEVEALLRAVAGGELPDPEAVSAGLHRPGTRTRVAVKVQEGCDQGCSYCLVPKLRGPSRSRPMTVVLAEIRRLVEAGASEIVLTGTHLGAYGRDLTPPSTLSRLIGRILGETDVLRLRLSSVEASELDAEFFNVWPEERLAGYLHLPLQSGSAAVLRRMNRPYGPEEYLEVVERLRLYRPSAGIGADVLVGFPGESREDFAATLSLVRRARLSRLHVFPYSERPGTPAADFTPQVPVYERRRRAAEMREAGRQLAEAFAEGLKGRVVPVLAENIRGGLWFGYTDNYVPVRFSGRVEKRGAVIPVRVERREGTELGGTAG